MNIFMVLITYLSYFKVFAKSASVDSAGKSYVTWELQFGDKGLFSLCAWSMWLVHVIDMCDWSMWCVHTIDPCDMSMQLSHVIGACFTASLVIIICLWSCGTALFGDGVYVVFYSDLTNSCQFCKIILKAHSLKFVKSMMLKQRL